jgi:hypothetical protein
MSLKIIRELIGEHGKALEKKRYIQICEVTEEAMKLITLELLI